MSKLYVLMSENNTQMVAVVSNKEKAERWAQFLHCTYSEVINGDEKEFLEVKTGYMNLLEYTKPAIIQHTNIAFSDVCKFPDPNETKLGDIFYKPNLENTFFTVPIDKDVNALAEEFWETLRKRGLNIERKQNGTYQVAKLPGFTAPNTGPTEISGAGAPETASNGSTNEGKVQGIDPAKLRVSSDSNRVG